MSKKKSPPGHSVVKLQQTTEIFKATSKKKYIYYLQRKHNEIDYRLHNDNKRNCKALK